MNGENEAKQVSRRRFLKTTGAAVPALTVLSSGRAFSSEANSRVQVGIIGTGGRGTFDGNNLVKTRRAEVVALADYFDFQLTKPAEVFGVDPSRCYSGLDGYRHILDLDDVDAVLLTAPPYSRPRQFEEAVRAGKHVFAEKPIAVDTWGCHKFLEAGRLAEKKKLTVVAGLQTRYERGRQRIAQWIHEGAIGSLVVGNSERMGGDLWRRGRPAHFTERDHQIRHWLYYLWASGDFIVEMHVHNLDVINWFTGLLPVSAYGKGGRTVRTDIGDIYDHLNVLYEYPGGFHLTHTGTQIPTGAQGQQSQIIGSEGSFDSENGLYTKDALTMKFGDIRAASEEEMRQFVDSILGNGPYVNNSEYVTTSTFTAILGRTAAYRNAKVVWDELWEENERIAMPV